MFLEVRGNTTVKAVFVDEPKYSLTVLIRGEGSCTVGNKTYWMGERFSINCTPAEGWELESVSLDGEKVKLPYTVIMDGDHLLEVVFKERRILEINAKYVLKIVSNVENAKALVNGEEVELPYAVGFNESRWIDVEGVWSLPYNETLNWWLAWYNLTGVDSKNKTIKKITTYYKSKTISLKLDGNYTLEIHYVKGLKNLPYVLKVWTHRELSPDRPKIFPGRDWPHDVEIEDGYLRFYNFRDAPWSVVIVLLEFDDGVKGATVRVWDNWKTIVPKDSYGSVIIPIRLKGQLFLFIPAYNFIPFSGEEMRFTCWLEPYNETHEQPRCVGIPRIDTCYGAEEETPFGRGDICFEVSLKGRLGTPYNVTILPDTMRFGIYMSIKFPVRDESYEVYVTVLEVWPEGVERWIGES